MLLSQTAHYALRAVYYLASTGDDRWLLVKDIAAATGIPAPYLARILSTLAKKGLLASRTGINGGFRVADSGTGHDLYDVVSQFDNLEGISACIFGFTKCCENGKCSLHIPWCNLKAELVQLLKSTSLGDLRTSFKKFDWSKLQF
ncbi:MAG: Rrf2 family transcriptional regulator [Planctomycetota bacterium]